MRVAIVRTHLHTGGVEVNLQHIAIELKKAGHDIDVYIHAGSNNEMAKLYQQHDIPLKVGIPNRFHDYEVVIAWSPSLYPRLAMFQHTLVCIVGNRKLGYYSPEIRDRFPVKGCICDSQDTEDFVRDFSDTVECTQWHHLIPPADLARERTSKQLTFGTLCSMREQKRIDRIIMGYADYLKTNPDNSFLLLGGDGPMRAKWEELALWLLPRDKYKFTGFVRPTDMGDFLSQIDSFVNVLEPGEGGICMSLANAVGAGCVPICNDVAGIKENFLDDTKYYLYSDEDFDRELPKAMVEIADNFDKIAQWRYANQQSYTKRYNQRGDIVQWLQKLCHCSG